MKTLKILAGVGLVNLALVLGLVLFFDATTVPASPVVPVPSGQVSAPTSTASVTVTPPAGGPVRGPSIRPTPEPSVPTTPPPTGGSTPPPVVAVPPPSNQCIVTIQGNRYDVAPLRSPHPGGDIFVCGTDMTATFFTQHDQAMLDGKMQQFRVQ